MRARAYAMLISQLLLDRFELLRQMEQFHVSPGFRAAFGYDGVGMTRIRTRSCRWPIG